MATVAERLTAIRDSLLTEVEIETAYRAKNGPKPTYMSRAGKRVEWTEWLKELLAAIKDLNAQIDAQNNQDDPYEIATHGWT